jgi:hypothetical protein
MYGSNGGPYKENDENNTFNLTSYVPFDPNIHIMGGGSPQKKSREGLRTG